MHPLLFKIGPIPIHTYGFLIAIGFLFCLETIKRLSVKAKMDVDRMLDVTFWCLVIGFLGARSLFVITRWEVFVADPMAFFRIWEGGLVFYGGPLAVLFFMIWYLRKHKISYWKAMDVLIPGLVINHVFGRFGCLAAGCCYGKPTESDWGVRLYSDLVERSYQGIPLHPTQIYEAVSVFILYLGLLWTFKRRTFDGQVGLIYFMTYPIIRSIIEIYRGDTVRGFIIEDILSTSQFISILVFLGAAIAFFYRLKNEKHKT